MKKKILAGLLSGAMALSLAACGGGSGGTADTPSGSSSTPSASETTPAASETTPVSGESYTVGICQQMTHEALDAATQGFKDALNEKLPGQVTFEEQDAGGEYANCGTIMDGFGAQGVDLILANASYPLQAAA